MQGPITKRVQLYMNEFLQLDMFCEDGINVKEEGISMYMSVQAGSIATSIVFSLNLAVTY